MPESSGRVIETTGSWYKVKTETGLLTARLKGKLRLSGIKLTNPVAVGDLVKLENTEDESSVVISAILPRKNQIIRISPRKKGHDQIIAANIDQAFIINSMRQPRSKLGFLNRMLVTLCFFEIKPIIVYNKVDIYTDSDKERLAKLQHDFDTIGFDHLEVSALKGDLGAIPELVKGKTSVFSGSSGVGKSTIINALIPGLDLKTKEISVKTNKGVHTTTYATMYDLPSTGYVIDTPGIKEYGVTGIDPYELSFYFPEFAEVRMNCKFNNCQHVNEPSCAIIEGVENGALHEWRYKSYLLIREELIDYQKQYQ